MKRSHTAKVSAADVGPFFDLASDLMCILDSRGYCIRVNRAFVQKLGYSVQGECDSEVSLEEMRTLSSIAHPDDSASTQAHLSCLVAGAPEVSFTHRYVARDAQIYWLSWTFSAVDADSSIADSSIADGQQFDGQQFYGVAQDVTQTRLLQDQLAKQADKLSSSTARYEALAQVERALNSRASVAEKQLQIYANATCNMQVGLYVWQLEDRARACSLRLVATNPATEKFTGISPDSIMGETILTAFPALADTDIPEQYATVVRTQQARMLGEVVYGDERVEKSIFAVKAFPLPDSCVGVTFDNITLHKRMEVIRHEQEAQLRVMFAQVNIGMARLSAVGQWIQSNRYICDLLGYSPEALASKTIFDVVHSEDKVAFKQFYQKLSKSFLLERKGLTERFTQDEIESRYVTAEGKTVWTLTTPSAVYDRQGELLYLIAVIQDITKRKEALKSLKQQKNSLMNANLMLTHTMRTLETRNAELDQFAYVTSHDLKAPLRAIANLATWIEEDLAGRLPAENVEQLNLLKNRVHRMEGLINGLLAYSRIGRTHQSSEQVDVSKLLEAVVTSLPTASFTIAIAPDMPQLQAKRTALFQVFSHLIENAVKHHHRSDGTVEISVKDLGRFYQFTVADDGPGIDAAFHQKVFTIFQTLRSRDELESTGIGLSLVQKTILAEGGEIHLFSKEGEGATFQFTWPKLPHPYGPTQPRNTYA